MTTLTTSRLILRPWKREDFEPFAAMNADPRVMEFFPSTSTREESDQSAERLKTEIEQKGWGFWAVSLPGVADFIGFIGLRYIDFSAPFTPAVEIGWRLAYDYWGKGYAVEGAKAALEYGFNELKLKEIISFTAEPNMRSRRVMEKLGMQRDLKGDFDNPKIPEGHPLRKHVLYRIQCK